jgi:hypothetical protein
MNFKENEIKVSEIFFPSTVFVGKLNINYYYLFINLWDQFNNCDIFIVYVLMEIEVSYVFFY